VTPGEAIGLGLALAIAAALVTTAVIGWRETHIAWRPLEGMPGTFCFGDSTGLVTALHRASLALWQTTTWVESLSCLSGLHVLVMPTESWIDGWFRKVAGLQRDDGVAIGPSHAALTHELAHRVCQLRFNDPDADHIHWRERFLDVAESLCASDLPL
jgi:hypothetical protein